MKTNPRLKSFSISSIILFIMFGLSICSTPYALATQHGGISRSEVNPTEIRETIAANIAEQKIEYKKIYDRVVQTEEQRIADPKSEQSQFIKYALKFEGTPYWYGGATPNGFDCSGFVGYVIKKVLGKNVNHSATSQMQLGPRVNDPLPGDLVGFGYGNYFSHIGIYIGNGKVIDALNPYRDTGIHDLSWMKSNVGPAVFVRIIEPHNKFNPNKITKELIDKQVNFDFIP